MKVAVYHNNKDIRIEERPIPKIGPGEVLLKIHAASICGSDVMEWYRVRKGPRILGHEVAGEIVDVGLGVQNYKKGDRVVASHHVPCYKCHYCKLGHHTLCDTLRKTNFDPGGFVQFVRLPEINVRYGIYPLPDTMSYEEGTLVEPLACTLRAQRKAAIRPGQTVVVIGSGIAGLFQIHLAKSTGIDRIIATDINPLRLKAAKSLGADFTYAASENLVDILHKVNQGRLADVVIVCAGAMDATKQALDAIGDGGTILFYAMVGPDQVVPLSLNEIFWKKGVTLMSSYAASPEDHREAIELIKTNKVQLKEIISHRLPFNEIAKGFELVSKAQDSLKVIINLV